jgi:hypothetical protein
MIIVHPHFHNLQVVHQKYNREDKEEDTYTLHLYVLPNNENMMRLRLKFLWNFHFFMAMFRNSS